MRLLTRSTNRSIFWLFHKSGNDDEPGRVPSIENFLFSTTMPVLDIKVAALKALKPLTTRSFTKSSLTVSTWEHSMSLSRSFLQMKVENQNIPRMTRVWLENWHFQSGKNLLCKQKFTNMVLSLCWQMSKFTFVRFLICLFRPALDAAAIYRKTA